MQGGGHLDMFWMICLCLAHWSQWPFSFPSPSSCSFSFLWLSSFSFSFSCPSSAFHLYHRLQSWFWAVLLSCQRMKALMVATWRVVATFWPVVVRWGWRLVDTFFLEQVPRCFNIGFHHGKVKHFVSTTCWWEEYDIHTGGNIHDWV